MTNLVEDSIVTGKNDDGTEFTFDLNICNLAAEQAVESLWEKEGVINNFDFTASMYSVFIQCVNVLSNSGFITRELLETVVAHSDAADICPDCGELMVECEDDEEIMLLKDLEKSPEQMVH